VTSPEPDLPANRPPRVSSGNTRITVAFPFSKITVSQPDQTLAEIAEIVRELAEHTAALAEQVDPDRVDAVRALVQHAAALADELED
jgi:hypothetical protein